MKLPRKVEFHPFHEIYGYGEDISGDPKLEEKLLWADFVKMGHPRASHLAFLALDKFIEEKEGALPRLYNVEDAQKVASLAREIAKQENLKEFLDLDDENTSKEFDYLISVFAMTARGVFAPLSAYLGGVVA